MTPVIPSPWSYEQNLTIWLKVMKMDLDGAPADRQVYITPAFRKCGRSKMYEKTKNSERAIPEFKNPLSPGEKCLKPQTSYPFDVASET